MIFQHLIDDCAQLVTRRRLRRDRASSTTRMAARGHGLNIRRWSFVTHFVFSVDPRTKRDLQEGCLSVRRPRLWAAAKLFASVPRTIGVLQRINDHHMMWCDVCENEGDYCAGIFSQSKEHVLPEGRHTDRRFSPCRTGRGQTTGSGRQPWSTFLPSVAPRGFSSLEHRWRCSPGQQWWRARDRNPWRSEPRSRSWSAAQEPPAARGGEIARCGWMDPPPRSPRWSPSSCWPCSSAPASWPPSTAVPLRCRQRSRRTLNHPGSTPEYDVVVILLILKNWERPEDQQRWRWRPCWGRSWWEPGGWRTEARRRSSGGESWWSSGSRRSTPCCCSDKTLWERGVHTLRGFPREVKINEPVWNRWNCWKLTWYSVLSFKCDRPLVLLLGCESRVGIW